MYLLMGMVGLAVLTTTSEIKVVRSYLFALWLADIGHIALTWYGLGSETVANVAGWNDVTWRNIRATSRVLSLCKAWQEAHVYSGLFYSSPGQHILLASSDLMLPSSVGRSQASCSSLHHQLPT
jgi:hypothetical protein